jgi:DNA-binding YbaB/EbfC family protein
MHGMKNMGNLMKQAKKLQEDMAKAQEELGTMTVTGTAGGQGVTVEMNGHHHVQSIKINPDVVDKDDVEMLEDLLLTAINDAAKKVSDMAEQHMGKYTKGFNIPGLF